MKIFFSLIKVLFVCLFLTSGLMAKQSNYFNEGIKLFEKKEFENSINAVRELWKAACKIDGDLTK